MTQIESHRNTAVTDMTLLYMRVGVHYNPLTQDCGYSEMPRVMEPIRVMCGLRLLMAGTELLLFPARCDL